MTKKQKLLSLFLVLALTVPAPLVLAAEPEDGTEPRPEAAVSAEAEALPETPAGAEGTSSLRLMTLNGDGTPMGPSRAWW